MLKQIIEEECIELVRKEVELAENDPVADLSQIMSNVYIDNSKRTHGLRQTSSAANSTMRAREPQARSIDRSASGYTTLLLSYITPTIPTPHSSNKSIIISTSESS
jgi:hypothetical protein